MSVFCFVLPIMNKASMKVLVQFFMNIFSFGDWGDVEWSRIARS
jgi:hypothetical protein